MNSEKNSFEQKKRQITKSLLDAMRNFPPRTEEMYTILDEIKEVFPEIQALDKTMKTIGNEGVMTLPWLEVAVRHGMVQRVNRRLKRKPLHPERAIDAFANLVLLVFVLFYVDDIQNV